ncbi:MAG: hypothetical protein N3E47_02210 [Candidatus Bathyarchaeota archaeon]|nr:hypothetical protein [Candidatus Bathyarchaeota archaeon]
MMLKAEYKVEGGKLIKVQLAKREGKIDAIKITGDFFMHPEDLIDELEKALLGCPLNENAIAETIRRFVRDRGVILLGATPEDFAKCIIKAGGGNG